MLFQSTLPAWGATKRRNGQRLCLPFQSTLPAWGATEDVKAMRFTAIFQSTLPAWGATFLSRYDNQIWQYFNPRSPHGERLCYSKRFIWCKHDFNPRSPHGERLCEDMRERQRSAYFNPRSPHGERLFSGATSQHATPFQSTLPAWGATPVTPSTPFVMQFQSTLPAWGATLTCSVHPLAGKDISIHAPRMGSDSAVLCLLASLRLYFNPRSPHGERPLTLSIQSSRKKVFQSTLPAWGATNTCEKYKTNKIFQSTLPAWGATAKTNNDSNPQCMFLLI